jgi:hypothetical protein
MILKQPHKTLPESILKMILEQFISEGLTHDDMMTVYEDTGTFDDIKTILKKFGFTDVEYEDIGFFAELFILNEDNIDGNLIIPKPKKFNLSFKVTGRKYFTEWYALDYTAYNIDFVRDMFNSGDLSYYDGELVDEDTNDTEVDDWDLRDIAEVKPNIFENKSKKPLFESKKGLNNELKELQKLKMVIEERIRLLRS